ncbi:hypothetical protein FNV43_RR21777 [Rhamnella rubrinervis]|uniref:Uncharacterized protein n=1 Tax=Rhamnella rubrinervis TaxID=2594499 RepID=A0A8K0E0N3_9ROSA|nr:hypothetical protein FNV43_RR21777 [Rhamnella rubrinervis]
MDKLEDDHLDSVSPQTSAKHSKQIKSGFCSFQASLVSAQMMRVSDGLVYYWNYVWVSSFWIFKLLEVGGFCSPLQGYSSLTILILSATVPFLLIFVALVIDGVAATLGSDTKVVRLKFCRGGICWHSYHHCPIDCQELKEIM